MTANFKLPRGTYDILPQQSKKWQFVSNSFRNVAERYGYGEIVTPIFEQATLFERSVGNTSDIIEKEMYIFKDKKNRVFALRPEGTAPVVRSVVENKMILSQNPIRLYYIGPMFRYDRPQKGRYRQFYQYGLEYIGSDDPYIDAEVIALAHTFLTELGLTNFYLEINSIGCSECSKEFDNALIEYFLPFKNILCEDCRTRLDRNPKRLLDCKISTCAEIAEKAPSILGYLDEKCKVHFENVKNYLEQLNIPYKVNPKIVRGLDYYTKTAFEFIDTNLGAQSTLIGGGRYDGLMKQIGGKDFPGIGFAGGFERLLLSLETENINLETNYGPTVYFISLGDKAKTASLKLIQQLRQKGISCDFTLDKNSLKAQMKAADKSKAKYALILGENELNSNNIIVKTLTTSEQIVIKISELINYLQKQK